MYRTFENGCLQTVMVAVKTVLEMLAWLSVGCGGWRGWGVGGGGLVWVYGCGGGWMDMGRWVGGRCGSVSGWGWKDGG